MAEHPAGAPGPAANEGSSDGAPSRDLNRLAASVTARVIACAAVHPGLRIELALCPQTPLLAGDPVPAAFALAGVLVAQLRTIARAGRILLRTDSTRHTGHVAVLADEPPVLDFVRAIEATRSGDPTLAHCRRLVEQAGGRIALRAEGTLVGFELCFPLVPLASEERLAA